VNTAAVPGWLVELRNGLREVGREVGENEPRDDRLALRELRERVEREVLALEPAGRGRGWPASLSHARRPDTSCAPDVLHRPSTGRTPALRTGGLSMEKRLDTRAVPHPQMR
jgi:hypothetical protein